jgi:hypothetical protein
MFNKTLFDNNIIEDAEKRKSLLPPRHNKLQYANKEPGGN